uniref:KY-like immunoglobulin-like domain-containing protein n=1 Tax=Arion vulgaris TaxID=1028688 RepID=A0A0B7AHJ6_9EUPU
MMYRSRSGTSDSKIDVFFDRFVLFEKQKDFLRFALRFPIKGSFKFDIYGLDVQDGDVFDLCCTYIINCPRAKHNCLPLPDCPPLGWGPDCEIEASGLIPVTHKQAEIVSTDGFLEIRLAKNRVIAFYQLLKHSLLDDATLSKYSVAELKTDEAIVYLRLPQKGEYALKLFAQDLKDQGIAKNILNYLITCNNTNSELKPFPNISNGLIGRNPKTSKSYGVDAVSHPQARLIAKNGKIVIEFRADLNVELVCEMHTIDGKAAQKMQKVVTNSGNMWKLDLDMPVQAEYSLNVFAHEKGHSDQIYNVHSYLIKSEGRKEAGEDVDNDETNVVDTSIPTETLDTSEPEVTIPISRNCTNVAAAIHRRNGYDPHDPSQIKFLSSDDINVINVKLRNYGEYMLNFYEVAENGNTAQIIAKYQINRKRPGELYHNNISSIMADIKPSRQSTPMSKGDRSKEEAMRQARRNVQSAIDLKDANNLDEAIKRFIKLGADENDPLLRKAKQLLQMLKAKSDLIEASQKRNQALLEKAIAHARSVNVNHELDVQIALAIRLRDHLATIEKLRHTVLDMEAKTVSEIKSYSNPPDGVHQCMIATFLLLGHKLSEVKNWQQVQVLLGKTGKESLMRKILNFDAQAVPIKRAQVAKKIIQPYNKEQIRDVSAGAATFYNWAVGMIDEVDSYGGAEQEDPMRLIK